MPRPTAVSITPVALPRSRGARLVGVGACLAAATWALWPLSEKQIPQALIEDTAASADEITPPPFDPQAFRTPLWLAQAPPPPPLPAPIEAPPPVFNASLLGVVRLGESLRAIFYDPARDAVVHLAVGDTIAGWTIERVETEEVVIREPRERRVLALRERPQPIPGLMLTPVDVSERTGP